MDKDKRFVTYEEYIELKNQGKVKYAYKLFDNVMVILK